MSKEISGLKLFYVNRVGTLKKKKKFFNVFNLFEQLQFMIIISLLCRLESFNEIIIYFINIIIKHCLGY
jgi:hypothetical protein